MKGDERRCRRCPAQRIFGPASPKDSARRRANKTSSRNRNRGIAVVWVAFMLFTMVLVVGFGLDGARLYIDAHQLQNAADAAALAGAQYVKAAYIAAADGNPNNDYDYPAVAFRIAQEFASQNRACKATVNLHVPNLSSFDQTADVVIGHYHLRTRQFTPYDPGDSNARTPNAVKVVARQTADSPVNDPMPLLFGRIVGVDTANVVRVAIALSQGTVGPALIALEEYPELYAQYRNRGTGLQMPATVNVNNGAVQVNSRSQKHPWKAFRADGSFELNCDELNVCGGVYPYYDDPYWDTVQYDVFEGADLLEDPVEHVPDLDPLPAIPLVDPITGDAIDDWTDDIIDSDVIATHAQQTYTDAEGKIWKVLTLAPGYYPGGVRMTSATTSVQVGTETDPVTGEPVPIYETYWLKLELQSGVYALGGAHGSKHNPGTGLYINGGTFEAEGVMLYITQSQTGVYGAVDIRGGTQTHVKIHEALDPDDWTYEPYPDYIGTDYKYLAIFQDRNNTNEAYVNGSSEIDLKGTLYFRNANFRCAGDGLQAGTQLVAGTVEVDGGAVINIDYDWRFWTPAWQAVLVE